MKIFELEVGKEYVCNNKRFKVDQNKTLYIKTDYHDWLVVKENYNDIINYDFIDADIYYLMTAKIDTKVLVRNSEDDEWVKRHLAGYEDGNFFVFMDGKSSYTTTNTIFYNYIKLYKDEELMYGGK